MNTLTRLEELALRQYRSFHDRPPTSMSVFLTRRWLRAIFVYGFGALMMYWLFRNEPELTAFAGFLGGMLLGLVMASVILNLRFVKLWPLIDEIIDWPKVERITAEGRPDLSPQNPFQTRVPETGNPFQSPGA